MALDRESIAKRDFPTLRRGGYDPAAVDAHLDALARELAGRESAPASLSGQAGEQVKAIVEAAERGAQEMRASARAEAREHVARVAEAADRLRARIEQLERDVTQLVIDLRANAERLRGDLAALQTGVGTLQDADTETPLAPEHETEPPAAPQGDGDAAAARLVALNMALSGTPREETDRFLAEHYELPDRAALLDEVYAVAGA